jgi:hypothetical protein
MDKWIKKMWYLHNGVLLSQKEEWNFVIHRKMDGTGEHHLNEVSQAQKAKNCVFSLICGLHT